MSEILKGHTESPDFWRLLELVKDVPITRLRELAEADADGCEYHCDNVDDSPWECSRCGAAWSLDGGNPFTNNMRYCSDCGRPIKSIRYNEWYYESDEDCGDREIIMTREGYAAAALAEKGG